MYTHGQMKLSALREETKLSYGKLAHALSDLEEAHLVLKIGSPGTYTYQITKFGALLHETALR